MFSLVRPSARETDRKIGDASRCELMQPEFLSTMSGLRTGQLPAGYVHDRSRIQLGEGSEAFQTVVRGFEEWRNFDLGWVKVRNPSARIEIGQIVAVQIHSLGLWSLNLSQIVEVAREPLAFGFVYKTTLHHLEKGEERFLLTLDPQSGSVWYELEAVSRPRDLFARLGFPVTRMFQHRFARDSCLHMQETVGRCFRRQST